MKTKILLTIASLVLLVTGLQAQTFKKGDFDLNAGIGLGYTYSLYSGVSSWPAIVVSGEKGVSELSDLGVLSIGGTFGFKHISLSGTGTDWSWNDFYIGARGALHLAAVQSDKLDVYGGASLGVRIYTFPEAVVTYSGGWPVGYDIEKKAHTTAFFGIFGGAKYSFSEKFAGFAELGYDIAWLKLGVSFKL
jgi:hypothetical protein